MIARIKNKIESVQMQDVNKTLRIIATYAWVGTGVLFACYIYFVGSITFSIIKQRGLEQENKSLVSEMSREELAYLSVQKGMTLSHASELGLIEANTISFAAPVRAFAWNVGR